MKAMLYYLPPANEAIPVPSPPKCLQSIHGAHLNQESSREGSCIESHTTEALYPHIAQLVVPAQPNPSNKRDFEASGHQAHFGGLVITSAPNTTGNQVIRPLSQHMSVKIVIVIPNRPKQACRISTTHQNPLTLVLPSEPKALNSKIDSAQSMPVTSNAILAANILSEPENFAMDIMDVYPIPLQINPLEFQGLKQKTVFRCSGTLKSKQLGHVLTYFGKLDLHARCITLPDACDIAQEWPHLQKYSCMGPVTENWNSMVLDTLAVQIRHQATPEPCKIDYKEGLNDPIKRAMEDYQQMFSVACKRHRSVLEQQKRLVEELEILQMEQKKYAM
ncbi:hypothetical protein PAXRUDRAFT_155567 [Paxillus rubicundulus Ve08.2h10]|uniref:Uncharacterized protein n=1 Tax=Paxillus rubicundulus Ve08.2h10 TaxID=930991 RepID=A0A0D0CFX7_9AGAM|nr:hypothetical protein PAXRUDRAFT_155567 [Paxillus rubicundulus Ve08.2h10]